MSLLGSVIPGWKWISGTVGVIVIGLVVWWIVDAVFIGPRDLPKAQRDALEIAAQDLHAQLTKRLDETDRFQLSLAILPVAGDTGGGEALDVIKKVLKKDERFAIPGDGVLNDIKKGASEWLLGSDSSGPEKLLNERGELDGVLRVSLTRENRAKVAGATLEGKLYEHNVNADGKREKGIAEIAIAATGRIEILTGDAVSAEEAAGIEGTFWRDTGRFLLCVILALGIPFLWLPVTDFVREAVRRHNNNSIAIIYVVVVTLTAIAPYAAFFIFKGAEEEAAGAFTWIVGIAMAAGAGFWTYSMHSAWSERV